MYSYMTIQVRAVTAKAQAKLAAIRAEQLGVAAAARTANSVPSMGAGQIPGLIKFGNRLQWTGRQIQYNFTLPILLAAGAAVKFQLDIEKATAGVVKVYGDQAKATQFQMKLHKDWTKQQADTRATKIFRAEVEALGHTFEALSERYGTAQKDVIDIAAAWAAAGASGVALARSVDLTMKAIVIGDMDAVEATKALISIQAQYKLSAEQLNFTLAQMNAIENQTAVTMPDLITAFARAAGVAKNAGISTRYLGAMISALVPASGSAAQAGNALKTIISRLLAPTKQVTDTLHEMGIEVDKQGWASANATDRINMLADAWKDMTGQQQTAASSFIAGRYQINKFQTLMDALINQQSYYHAALDATATREQVFTTAQRELNTVLESNPQRLKQIWIILQNAMANVIQPMLPYIISIAHEFQSWVSAFSEMDPRLQKFIVLGLLLLAVVGPILRYLGSFITLVAVLGKAAYYAVVGPVILAKAMWNLFHSIVAVTAAKSKLFAVWAWGRLVAGANAVWIMLGRIWALMILLPKAAAFAVRGITASFMILPPILATVRALFLVFIYGIEAILFALAPIATAAFAAMGTAMVFIGGVLIRLWTQIQFALGVVTSVGMTLLTRIWVAGFAVLASVMTFFGSTLVKLWTLIQFALGVVSSVAMTMLARVYVAGLTALKAIVVGFGYALTFLWAGIQFALGVITSVAMTLLTRLYVAALFILETVTIVFGKAWQIIWTAIWASIRIIWAVGLATLEILLGAFLSFVTMIGPALLAALVSPWTYLIIAAVGLLYLFRTQIQSAFSGMINWLRGAMGGVGRFFEGLINGIIGGFNQLPGSVQNAMIAVVRVVRDAALQVYEWFSYLNPFAHHSPSLVESTKKGMDQVRGQHSDAADKAQKHAGRTHSAFKQVRQAQTQFSSGGSSSFIGGGSNFSSGPLQLPISSSSSLSALRALQATIDRINNSLRVTQAMIDRQQAVVDRWQFAVNKINLQLNYQQGILERLQATLQGYQDKLSQAQDALNYYANAPLEGMAAMEERIWRNQRAQTKLNLEIWKMEQAYGSLDDIKAKLDSINGAQELLRGTQASLRAAGAGSEILRGYDKQINKLEDQKTKYEEQAEALEKLQAELEKLQNQAEHLDLVKAMRFDELQRRIDQAANHMKELSFQEIMEGIRKSNRQIDFYQQKVDGASRAVDRQQAVVDALTRKRDAYQNKLNDEQAILDALTGKYQKLNKAAGAGSEKDGPLLPSGKDFPNVGGKGIALRKNWRSQVPQIDKFTQSINDQMANAFADMNPFAPFREWWDKLVGWIDDNITPAVTGWMERIESTSHSFGNPFEGFGDDVRSVFLSIAPVLKWFRDIFGAVWRLLGPDIIKFCEITSQAFVDLWNAVGPPLEDLMESFHLLGDAWHHTWIVLKPLIALMLIYFGLLAKVFLSVFNGVIGPLLEIFVASIKFMVTVVAGVLEVLIRFLAGDFSGAWEALKRVMLAPFIYFYELGKGVLKLIGGILWGFVKGVAGFFKWLYDVLFGHSIIPDMMHAFVKWFNWIITPIKTVLKTIWTVMKTMIALWIAVFKLVYNYLHNTLGPAFTWFWHNIISPVMNGIKTVITNVWNNGIKPIFQALHKFITETLPSGFRTGKDAIKTAWGLLKSAAKAPVQFIVNTVYDEHLRPMLNHVIGLVPGLDPLESVHFKKGGLAESWVPGPGRGDVYPGMFEPGEFIFRRAVAQQIKRRAPGLLDSINNEGVTGPKLHSMYQAAKFAHGGETGGGNPSGIYRPVGFGSITQGLHDQYTGFPSLDIGVPTGTPVHSVAPGIVSRSEDLISGGQYYSYGRVIQILHAGYESLYAHLSGRMAQLGMSVGGGQQIGVSGNTGNSFGSHLHFGVKGNRGPYDFMNASTKYGKYTESDPFNPLNIIPDWVKNFASIFGDIKGLFNNDVFDAGFGAMLKDGGLHVVEEVKDWAWDKIKSFGNFFNPLGGGNVSGALQAQEWARTALDNYGWGEDQFPPLVSLWNNESGWRWDAENPSSGAYGIPQALPPEKMGSIASDWKTNPITQMLWGLQYIKSSYGSPQGAWDFWQRQTPNHWYDNGGKWRPGTMGINSSSGTEYVFTPTQWQVLGAAVRKGAGAGGDDSVMAYGSSRHTTININGDLSFPNIKSGDDAKKFIKNLEIVAGAA